jgi:hypothetical protein
MQPVVMLVAVMKLTLLPSREPFKGAPNLYNVKWRVNAGIIYKQASESTVLHSFATQNSSRRQAAADLKGNGRT